METCTKEQYQMCPRFEKTFTVLGKKWNGLIINVLLSEGSQRFGEIANKIPNISDRVLVERLKELESEGLVDHVCLSKETKRSEYILTEKGKDLQKSMQAIESWSEKWN